tara:strand:- start:382 stop:504 length:123 start_codon:yes stop_codon:yes gene_type:complete
MAFLLLSNPTKTYLSTEYFAIQTEKYLKIICRNILLIELD